MFHHVVDSHLDERLMIAERSLVNLGRRDGSQEDYALINQSIFHMYVLLPVSS